MDLIKKNLKDMLTDRFYTISEQEEKEEQDDYLIYEKKNKKKVVVFFLNINEKVGVDSVKNLIRRTQSMEIEHMILLSKEKLTPFANRHIQDCGLKIEVFLFEELKFNITKHSLVPKHVLLEPQESQEIIEYYGKKNLPQIKHKDPISKYFDADVGSIFRIYRNEGGIFYRLTT